MSDLPLDETALQAASQTAPFVGRDVSERLISTYLRKVGFEVERMDRMAGGPDEPWIPEERLISPWVPVVQATAEETTKRIAEERDKGEVRTFRDPDSAAAYLRNEPVAQAESEEG